MLNNNRNNSHRALILLIMIIFTLPMFISCKGKSSDESKERWATTNKVNPNIDLEKVQDAFFEAKSPTEFEDKVNELYTGEGVVAIAVRDKGSDKQEVVGYVDKNSDGTDQEDEKLFTLSRNVISDTADGKKRMDYEMQGHGYNAGYHHSGTHDFLMGAMTAYFFTSMMMPRYSYATPVTRYSTIQQQQSSYRSSPAYKQTVDNTKSLGNSSKYGKMSDSKGSWKGGTVGGNTKSPSQSPSQSRPSPSPSQKFGGGSRMRFK